MMLRIMCLFILLMSVVLSFTSCSLWEPKSTGEAKYDSTLGNQSKGLTGAYSAMGSDRRYGSGKWVDGTAQED